jgi:FtsH-binding integral membrane protein
MGAMLSLPGAVGVGLAFDWRWSTAKLILQAQDFSILFILIAAIRAWRDFNWAEFGIWLFVGGLGLMLASIVSLFIYMETRKISQMQR